ncbi:YiiD C-terminal domain-containing protein [Desulfogranum japonicum]|uniref:YiiD C-terminal domain-containing protein n=1 Tax=Desulfogranum japonicum TaxID=231447 RepID=UPI00048AECE2|nr:YiiD C-terminal domain-containing protein [Desulfogranum japonicum]
MEITKIPFNKYIEIFESTDKRDVLELEFSDNMKNHLGTFHASAQFALAEACSGLALQNHYSDLANSVVPVLRKSETKFKRPASSNIKAEATICDETKTKFKIQFDKKGRASISVPVKITDENNIVTMEGTYEWFVQKM